ncbi:glycerophosphodiester phosphodiesterase [Candidatus Dependentiae bacterium]|nr:glycerophosphodiester phosphodiesterase [Candidatus Dependentiae bacterium]
MKILIKIIIFLFLFIVSLFFYQKLFLQKKQPPFSSHIQKNPFFIIGHRGACGYEPENTLSSFQKALELGVDKIELDVYVCKTGELVVFHDQDVDRITNGQGKISDLSFKELQSLLVKGKEHIPTLDEAITFINRKVPLIIELKGPNIAQPVAELLKKYLANGWDSQDFTVSSFDHEQLAEFKKLCPDIQTGALFSWWNMPQNDILEAKLLHVNFIGIDVTTVTDKIVSKIHHAGFLLFVWTINDKETADQMRTMKIDGIFSNYPDRVR